MCWDFLVLLWYNIGMIVVNKRVVFLYDRLMAKPIGPTGKEYRRLTRSYVRKMAKEDREEILARADQIVEDAVEDYEENKSLLLELGFMKTECNIYARCRLNSPGLRTLITERVKVTRFAKSEEILQINEGNRGVLLALQMMYGGEEIIE